MIRKFALLVVLGFGLALPAAADAFETVTERGAFLSVVQGKTLSRLGIKLDVLASGDIRGRAFGAAVTGSWQWQDAYFCRVLNYGSRTFERNCQVVQVQGDTVRFIADRGAGDTADLTVR